MESESLVAKEPGAHTLGTHLSVAGSLLDPVSVGLLVLVVISVILRLGHANKFETTKKCNKQ